MSTTLRAVWLLGALLSFIGTGFAAQKEGGGLPPPSERYAVVVGVGTYEDKSLDLYGADNDAKALAAALEKYAGFPKDQIALLTSDQQGDRKSTRNNILRKLREMATNASYSGLMLFAFSGHGIQKDGMSLLLPSDLRLSDLEDDAINVEAVTKNLRTAKQVLMFIDACREEKFAGAGGGQVYTRICRGLPVAHSRYRDLCDLLCHRVIRKRPERRSCLSIARGKNGRVYLGRDTRVGGRRA